MADFERIMGARVGELLTVLVLGEQPLKYHFGRDGNLFERKTGQEVNDIINSNISAAYLL